MLSTCNPYRDVTYLPMAPRMPPTTSARIVNWWASSGASGSTGKGSDLDVEQSVLAGSRAKMRGSCIHVGTVCVTQFLSLWSRFVTPMLVLVLIGGGRFLIIGAVNRFRLVAVDHRGFPSWTRVCFDFSHYRVA